MVARNAVGFGAESDPISILAARIADAPYDLTNKPEITAAGIVSFSWTPDYNGGSPILSYRVSYDQGLGGAFSVFASGITT